MSCVDFGLRNPLLFIKVLNNLRLVVEESLGGLIVRNTREHGLFIGHDDGVVSVHFTHAHIDVGVQEALVILLLPLFVLLEVL